MLPPREVKREASALVPCSATSGDLRVARSTGSPTAHGSLDVLILGTRNVEREHEACLSRAAASTVRGRARVQYRPRRGGADRRCRPRRSLSRRRARARTSGETAESRQGTEEGAGASRPWSSPVWVRVRQGHASACPESRSHCDPDLLRGRTRLLTRPDRARLERGGIPTPQGARAWSEQSVRVVLANPVYIGERYGVRDAHPAVVDRRVWNRAQKALRSRRRR